MVRFSDPAAMFAAVFDAHLAYVWRVLRHLGVRPADLDDLCQDVFLVVLRRLPDYRPVGDIRSWLYAICHHEVRNYRRRAHVRRERSVERLPEPVAEVTPLDQAQHRQALERVERAVAGLPEVQRQVFLLYELEGLPMKDIVATMGCPVQTGFSRLRAARAHVRTAMVEGRQCDG